MKVEVYCDESYPDLLSSQAKQAKYIEFQGHNTVHGWNTREIFVV